jgi:UDP-N-acetylglucosamine 2-epimerase (non-hydrolysing)
VGTRPEVIRLAPTIRRLDQVTDHVLVHTGQNYDYGLNDVFFKDLQIREPDHYLGIDTTTLGTMLGSVLVKAEEVLSVVRPDAVLILGDTNSAIAALIARRMKIPVYHMEAGNRSFDENVPEEINRRMVDHVADYNLVYTEHARRNLLSEGIHPSRIMLSGSPMREVLDYAAAGIAASEVLTELQLREGEYFLASVHREENVDNPARLESILLALNALAAAHGIPVLISTHPRTRKRLETQQMSLKQGLIFHPPFGFNDYVKLQLSAKLVLSDSGTISEESSILGFPAITLRDAIERPEALDAGSIITAGVSSSVVLSAVSTTLMAYQDSGRPSIATEYNVKDTSRRVVNFISSTAPTHSARAGIRRTDNADA